MDQQRVIDLLHAQPFQPFDIRTADGRAYYVDHPGFIARDRRGGVIIYFTQEDNRAVFIDLRHIVSLKSANRPSAA